MKNIIKVIALITITLILTISLFATSNDSTYVYEYDEITITFPDDTNFTESQRTKIAGYMLNGVQIMPFSLMCDLFGHSMGTSEWMSTTTHCVNSTAPRCRYETYSISTCSRCGYISSTRTGSSSMSCCP